jgi:pyruvate/2-oxoglutarate dehydrogenase complex dihydrolipoamide dehydrogenase (E3) component
MKFMLSTAVSAVERNGDTVKITAKDKKGEEVTVEGDYCLVSVGRKPYTDGLGLEKAGVELDERGRVKVNDHFRLMLPTSMQSETWSKEQCWLTKLKKKVFLLLKL